MGITVVLQDERDINISKTVLDPEEVIIHSLPDFTDITYSCIRFIDPYGDTIFNTLQARIIIKEWDKIKHSFSERNAETLWTDIHKLIVRCSEEPHTYLKFIGD